MNVLVIAGGSSGERDVSLRSGSAVQSALEAAGHKVTVLDPKTEQLDSEIAAQCDVAFPIIHGAGGEDGTLQQQLESLQLPYVGSDVASCQLTFDKNSYKTALEQEHILTPAGDIVDADTIHAHALAQQPFVLKPFDGGSSVDTFIVRDVAHTAWDDIARALKKYDAMLLEELIEGVEITVGVLGDTALPVIEIIPPENGEFDYENKYNGATQELCPPQHVDDAIQQEAQNLAARIHKLCGCRDLSRTDMIVSKNGEVYVLETNTLPGMTDQSLLPKAAAAAGFDMPSLCDRLVQMATNR